MNLLSLAKAGGEPPEPPKKEAFVTDVDIARAEAILRRARVVPKAPRTTVLGVEVGVAAAKLSCALLEAEPQLYLTMVDDYASAASRSEAYRATGDQHAALSPGQQASTIRAARNRVRPFGKRGRKLLVMPSVEAAQQLPDDAYDFVFIDADHSYEGARNDIEAWWPKVCPGGWLCGHDYGKEFEGVKRAVDEFVARVGGALELDADDTWFLRRPES